jgi:transcriptional regulator with XRE-family HTH domain
MNIFRRVIDMEKITAAQVKKLRLCMELSQELFAEEMGVTRSCVGLWEQGRSNPRGKNLEALIALYLEHVNKGNDASKKEGKAKSGNGGVISTSLVQDRLSVLDMYLLKARATAAAQFVADQYNMDYPSLKEALIIFLYGMEEVPARVVAQVLAGHE